MALAVLQGPSPLVPADSILPATFLERASDWAVSYAPMLVGAVITLVLGVWIAKLARRWSRSLLVRAHLDDTLARFLSSLGYFALLTLVAIAALGKLGVETTSFIAVIGAAGLAVGLALQGSLGNLAAGVMIMVFRPFRVGDGIVAGGHEGVVDEIQVFATVIHTADNKRVIVPNSAIVGGSITNLTANDTRRIELVLTLAGSNDVARTKQILAAAARSHPKVQSDPAPAVGIASIDGGALKLVLHAWCATSDVAGVTSDLNESLKAAIDREEIAFPVATTQVRQVA